MNENLTYAQILELLHQSDCEVTFKKVDGELRVMPCTLRSEVLPEKPLSENKRIREHNTNVISVWSLDRREWRSFRVDNVVSIVPIK
jgi:hypothetical protein